MLQKKQKKERKIKVLKNHQIEDQLKEETQIEDNEVNKEF
jgi:hypothetical protein